MSGIFGGGGAKAPDTSKQEALQEKQEARTKRQEAEEQRKLAAQQRARRTGGTRSLLSPDREDARRGLSSTLSGME
ncbi:MAG TPA: hypothetical protein VIC30_05525 [Orrella sp.]